ncbi:hypothetical protein BFJ71_g12553 [Fusarium oxysporum]|nr:hypothetical protein BFJ71_g12553 [Fusarium oxysporum]
MTELPLPEGIVDKGVVEVEYGVKGGCLVLAHVTAGAEDWVGIIDAFLVKATKRKVDGVMRFLEGDTIVQPATMLYNVLCHGNLVGEDGIVGRLEADLKTRKDRVGVGDSGIRVAIGRNLDCAVHPGFDIGIEDLRVVFMIQVLGVMDFSVVFVFRVSNKTGEWVANGLITGRLGIPAHVRGVWNVFIHELGHVLGLRHEFAIGDVRDEMTTDREGEKVVRIDAPDPNSVMNYRNEPPQLQQSDIDSTRKFYSMTEDPNGKSPSIGMTLVVDYTPR